MTGRRTLSLFTRSVGCLLPCVLRSKCCAVAATAPTAHVVCINKSNIQLSRQNGMVVRICMCVCVCACLLYSGLDDGIVDILL